MKWNAKVLLGMIFCVVSAAGQLSALAGASQAGFSQIVLPFPVEKPFHYEWIKSENALILQFPKSTPAEIEGINNYDEKHVRRLLIKDHGPEGTEVRMILRDRNVRAVVSSFKDPFRVSIDLFDKNYSESKDPESGIPITSGPDAGEITTKRGDLVFETPQDKLAVKPDSHGSYESPNKRKLLQAMPEVIESPNELKAALAKIDPGIGKSWSNYPPYIYRMQLAPYEGREAPTGEISPLQFKAISTSSAMADYASKLYDFGHEGRALAAYQQVLHHEAAVFERDAIHLWKFAETHLGQGNLTLAEGYYQTLLEKHPDHMMARFARLRKADIQALRAIEDENISKLPKLADQLSALPTRDNPELQAMIAIRNVWWRDDKIDQKSRKQLPYCPEDAEAVLTKLSSRIENPKTAYLASALVAHRITNKSTPWQNDYAHWLANFFNRYKNSTAAIATDELSTATKQKITEQFSSLFNESRYADVVNLYEQLPQQMKSISKDTIISWQIAESYRTLGQQDKAIPFYGVSATTEGAVDRFKSNFWLASLATKRSHDLKASAGNQERIRQLENTAKKADGAMSATWNKLKSDERSLIIAALGPAIQDVVASEAKLRTPPQIILEQYKTALTKNSPKMTGTSGTGNSDWAGNFSPSSSTVRLFDDLGRKFAELGMIKERRQAIELMKYLKPEVFEQDKAAAKVWASELTKLAEEHRKADEFLDAGELYTLIGDSALSEIRAESLYKGGLLLFRAGKKQDAIKALEKAKGDTTNLFYSKLATERLNQIDTK